MAFVTRTTKDNGTTAWKTGDTINQTDLEGDFTGITDQVDGNIENANIAAGAAIVGTKLANGTLTDTQVSATAAIQVSKLDQTAGQLDSDIVDDSGDDEATYKTTSDPGESGSVTLPTNLEEELQDMRYVLMRLALGANAVITDGTTAAAWFDGVSTGANLLQNPAFLDYIASGTTAPAGWTKQGTPTSLDGTTAITASEGVGHMLTITSAATADGISQTLAGLKASTRYLVEARTRPTTSIHTLKTTGASGTFGDLDIDSADGGSAWATLAGVVETDGTPTDIVVSLEAENGVDVWDVAWVSVREIGDADKHQRDAPFHVETATSTSATEATITTETTVEIVVPGDNYSVVVLMMATTDDAGGDPDVKIAIAENTDVAGVGAYANVQETHGDALQLGAGTHGHTHVAHFSRSGLTAGNVYGYQIAFPETTNSAPISDADCPHRLTVMLMRQG